MLATGLLPLEPPATPLPSLPPLPPVSPAVPVVKHPTGLLPISIPYPPSPSGTQRLVESPGTESSSSASSEAPSHRPAEEGKKVVKIGPHTDDDDALPVVRPANQRRSSHTLKLFLILLFIMAGCFAAFAGWLYTFYEQTIEPRLTATRIVVPPPQFHEPERNDGELTKALAAAHDQITALQTQVEELRAQQQVADTTLKTLSAPAASKAEPAPAPTAEPGAPSTQLTLADGQLVRLQTQVNELRAQQTLAEAQLQKLASAPAPASASAPSPKPEDDKTARDLAAAVEQIHQLQARLDTAAIQQAETTETLREMNEKSPPLDRPEPAPAAPPSRPLAPSPDPDTRISTVVAVNSEVGTELRLLKERNRLTLYADQALANASAEAMAKLWQSIRDPDLAFVKDGAIAEIVRVQHFYGSLRSLPPSYKLPVKDLFKDGTVPTEAELKDEQATQLLLDQALPPEIRTRAAMFLSGHKTRPVGDALIQAMRHDPNLLVVKAAQNTLQDNFELYEPRLFDAMGMQKAWDAWVAKNVKPDETPEKTAKPAETPITKP